MRALAWGRLLRLSLAPSAAADALCGLTLAAGGAFPAEAGAWRVVAASLCIYHGGLALNDWADREHDARTRPERPLPAGSIPAPAAAWAAAALLAAGIALAWSAAPAVGAWMAGVALLVALYDLGGRGPWSGPVLLALCRAGNLGAGFVFISRPETRALGVVLAAMYGVYVFLASRLGRMEDGDDDRELARRPRTLLLGAAVLLLALPALPAALPAWSPPSPTAWLAATALVSWSALGIARQALGTATWTRGLVERAMGGLLRRLLVFTAAACLLAPALSLDAGTPAGPVPAWLVGLAILTGYPLSFALRRVFPPS